MPRFSLKTLLIAAAVIPLAAYGLFRATPLLSSLAITIVCFSWCAMIVACLEGDGELRAFARGFLISSLLYVALALWVVPRYVSAQELITSTLLIQAHQVTYTLLKEDCPQYVPFYFVGESLWCLSVGMASGWLAGWLYRRRQKANQPNTETVD
jgi:hypothetical protein